MKLPSDTCLTLIFFIWVINLKSAASRPLSNLEDGIVDTGTKSITDTFLTQFRIPDGTLWNESGQYFFPRLVQKVSAA
ncbi:hypothetical protein BKA69DRAFT_1103537 [Paraphysoderma sedebokerense]|nr:hypothetical protein BKA69DRAFT_1103537 [Paraphysoderma sedebokerense]